MKTKGMEHQLRGLDACAGKRNFAFLMEQGTGKTWLTMADAERLLEKGLIDAIFVLAPNGVHTNWVRREIPTHMSVSVVSRAWRGNPTTKKGKDELEALFRTHYGPGTLKVFTMNIEAINSGPGFEWAKRFIMAHKCLCVVDESTRIKSHDAKRSKKAVELGRLGTARRILSGSPLTRSPADLFMQYHFLKEGLLGTTSFRAFNAEFSVLLSADDPKMIAILKKRGGKGFGIPQVVAQDSEGNPMYRNLDKLRRLIAPHSFRVTKEDCLDLPPKVYQQVYFELTPNQRKVYNQVREEYYYVIEREDFLEAVSFEAIAARTKLKQVTSGYISLVGEMVFLPPQDNPRMQLFKDTLEDLLDAQPDRQFIIWAQFKPELQQLEEYLQAEGYTVGRYDGDTPKARREEIIDEFQAGKLQFFVGHAQAAGIGLTLTAATCAIYFSCSENNELRMQSEDRCHRIGTKESVLYIDLIGVDSIDEDVQRNLAMKSKTAAQVIDGKGL